MYYKRIDVFSIELNIQLMNITKIRNHHKIFDDLGLFFFFFFFFLKIHHRMGQLQTKLN